MYKCEICQKGDLLEQDEKDYPLCPHCDDETIQIDELLEGK